VLIIAPRLWARRTIRACLRKDNSRQASSC
jgi:hypothetical protein